jgi:Recombination directionality factor-like
MPIELLRDQQDLRQLGEIRIGHRIPLEGKDRNGNPKSRPAKLDKFRLTSPSKPLLEKVAKLYGGEVKPWQPGNGGPMEWEVFTNVDRLPVLVRGYRNDEGGSASTEWFEHYDGKRLARKCDSVTEKLSGKPCLCDPDRELGWWDGRLCKPTTRLKVMLKDVPAIGNWLIISHGRNAAETLPPMARLLARADGYIPASLGIEERITYPAGDKPPNRFMVPILEVDLEPMELMSGGGTAAIGGSGHAAVTSGQKAIEAGRQVPDYKVLLKQANTVEAVRELWRQAGEAGDLDPGLKDLMMARSAELAPPAVENATAGDEPVDAEIVSEGDDPEELDRAYAAVIENRPGEWDMLRLNAEFAQRNGGVTLKSGTVAELRTFLEWLKGGAR